MTTRRIFLIFIICFLIYTFYCSKNSIFITNTLSHKRTNFLIIGLDSTEPFFHSDTVILVSYSPRLRQVDIVSIPRDTYVDVEEFKYRKISEIFAGFYYRTKSKYKSAQLLSQTITERLFVSPNIDKKVEIPYFLVIDYESFKKLIDIIGKIKIVVSEPMHYDDYAGNLHIHFNPGVYYMDGQQSLEYLRYRDRSGDIGRITRQQQFIKNFVKTLFSPKSIIKIPIVIYNFKKCFITNITFWELLNMILEFKNIKPVDTRFSQLPVKSYGRYVIVDQDVILSFIKYINDDKNINQYKDNKVLIEIYNATDKPKIAKQVAMMLRQKGYDVLDWGNWYCKQLNSKIIDSSHNNEVVYNLCNLLNIYDVTSVYSVDRIEGNLRPTIIVILGQDFVEK